MKQVRSLAKELLIKKSDDKSVEVNWSQKFLKRHSQIKTVYIPSLDKERAMTQSFSKFNGYCKSHESRDCQRKKRESTNKDMAKEG